MRNAFDASDPDRRTAAIATTQHGLITRAQARNTGLSDRQVDLRLERGAWERVLPGVFRIAGSPATGRQGMFAATLWAGRRAVLSHSAAGVLWGLDAARAGALEVTVESPRRLHHPAVVVHRTRALPRLDRVVHDGIRVTSVARTLVDLAGVLVPDHLELAVEDALRRELTSIARIRHRIEALGGVGRAGCANLRAIVEAQRPGHRQSGSAPETRLRRSLMRAGLGAPVPQFRVHAPGFEAYLDLAYPKAKVGIEYDSDRWHGGRVRRARDRARDHHLQALGWHVLHVGADELRDGARTVVDAVRALLVADALRVTSAT